MPVVFPLEVYRHMRGDWHEWSLDLTSSSLYNAMLIDENEAAGKWVSRTVSMVSNHVGTESRGMEREMFHTQDEEKDKSVIYRLCIVLYSEIFS